MDQFPDAAERAGDIDAPPGRSRRQAAPPKRHLHPHQLRRHRRPAPRASSSRRRPPGPARGRDCGSAGRFDIDHEGHAGWRADEILAQIQAWATAASPDFVLLHIGTNDLSQGQSVASTVSDIGGIIDVLRTVNPRIQILLAQLIAKTGVPSIAVLNGNFPALVADKKQAESPIVLVDQYTGFDPSTMTYDGTHPNVHRDLAWRTGGSKNSTILVHSPNPGEKAAIKLTPLRPLLIMPPTSVSLVRSALCASCPRTISPTDYASYVTASGMLLRRNRPPRRSALMM